MNSLIKNKMPLDKSLWQKYSYHINDRTRIMFFQSLKK